MNGELIGLLVGIFQLVVIAWLFGDPMTEEDLIFERLPQAQKPTRT